MARIRTIKPGFFTSEDVTRLTLPARLTWVGLWVAADDEGRAKAHPALVKAAVWPLEDDVTPEHVAAYLDELEANGRITRYVVDGTEYLAITKWHAHQRINRPTPSMFPPPPGTPHGALSEPSVSPHGGKGKGREVEVEGKGGATTRPAPFCDDHPTGTTKPCRACGNARRLSESWTPPGTPTPPSIDEAKTAARCQHGAVKGTCALCRRHIPADPEERA